jgi:hypothetical protein
MTFTVVKRIQGIEQYRYQGELLTRTATVVCLRAPFTFAERDLGYAVFRPGDLFTEWFYADRWYNLFQVQDGTSLALKGFYCNFALPATIAQDTVYWDDLALDLWVAPDGTMLWLDEAEYAAMQPEAAVQAAVAAARADLTQAVAARTGVFGALVAIPSQDG